MRKVLFIVFLFAAVIGTYSYRSSLFAIADQVLYPGAEALIGGDTGEHVSSRPIHNPSEDTTGPVLPASRFEKQTSFPPMSMVRHVQRRLLRVFLRSINAPTKLARITRPIRGIEANVRLRANIGSNPWLPGGSLLIRSRAEGYVNGTGRARLEVVRPPERLEGPLRIEKDQRWFQVMMPGNGTYLRRRLPESTLKSFGSILGLFWLGKDTNARLDSIRRVTVGQRDVYRIRVERPGGKRIWLFDVTREPLYRLLSAASEGPGGRLRFHFRYRSAPVGQHLREIQVDPPGVPSSLRLRFDYRDQRLRKVVVASGKESSDKRPVMTLKWGHGERYSRGARIGLGSTSKKEGKAQLRWRFRNGYPVKLTFRLNQNDRRVSLSTDSIRWLKKTRTMSLSEAEHRSRLSLDELTAKLIPRRARKMSNTELVESLRPSGSGDGFSALSLRTRQRSSGEATGGDSNSRGRSSGDGEGARIEEGQDTFSVQDPPETYRLAQRAFRRGEDRRAVRHLETLLEEYPHSAHGNFMMGVLLFRMESYRRALPYFRRATRQRRSRQIRTWGREYLVRLDGQLASTD